MADATSSTCQSRAPSSIRVDLTEFSSRLVVAPGGGDQQMRLTVSGEMRFSTGIVFAAAMASMSARA